MSIGVMFSVCSSVFNLLLIIIYLSKEKVDNIETKIYTVLIWTTLLGSLESLPCYFGVLYHETYPILGLIFSKLYLVFVHTYMCLIMYYYLAISNHSTKENPMKKTNIIMAIYYMAILAAIFVLPIYYNAVMYQVYTYGPAVNLNFAMATVCISTVGYCIIREYSRYKKDKNSIQHRKYLPIVFCIIFCSIAVVLQKTNPSWLFITTALSLVTHIMFHTIENPDVKMINQLNVARDQADRANRAKTDFLSSMSHEIRTPLNAIVGFSECIKQEKDIDSCYHDADDIIMASQNLLEIVNGILDISKIEANKMEIVVTNYRPKPIFENLAKLIVPRIGEKPIELNVHISEDLPDVLQGDSGKLKQITTNILTNAVKYTEHGYINFDVKCINTNDESKLIISVQDTGRGIRQDQMNKLFSKFQRLDEDKNTTIEGTGLGLAITKNFVEMLGGTITVQSRYGEGTKFTVCLKQKIIKDESEKAKVMQSATSIQAIDLSGKKVLIVDDNNLNIRVCSKILAQYNLDISSVDSGFECLELFKNGKTFDLILMDDMMPKMTGSETLANLKKIFPEFNIPTVVLTANNIIEKREQYLADGFDDCLAKPIEKTELNKILTHYLNKKEEPTTVKENNVEETLNLTNKKILLVDDNKLNLRVAENVLKIYNPIIETSNSGKECLDILAKNNYDLILMDDMMPEMTGTETMKILKGNESFTTPIVVLTANAIEGARENYLKEGFDDYLAKPIDKKELERVLKKFIVNDIKTPKPIEIIDENHYHTRNFLEENNISVEEGLRYLKTMDAYNDEIKDFLRDMPNKVIRINQYRLSKNMNNYIMEMHTLANDAKCLGIYKLYAMATTHELNAKDNNLRFIDDNFNELMLEINRVVTVLKKYRG